MSLRALVEIYRKLGGSCYDRNRTFSGSGQYSEYKKLISDIRNSDRAYIDPLVIDNEDYLEDDSLPDDGVNVEFSIKINSIDENTFYYDVEELVTTQDAISKGVIPDEFYIVNDDYYSCENSVHKGLQRLRAICDFILGLKKLSFFVDDEIHGRGLRLLFLKPQDDESIEPLVIETTLDANILNLSFVFEIDELESLIPFSNDVHYSDRKLVFNNTLSEFFNRGKNETNKFYLLIKEWEEFKRLYIKNYDVYVNKFSFQKAKKEVAEAELELSNKLSDVLGSISGKLLGIPLSYAALVPMLNLDNYFSNLIIFLGLLVSGVIIYSIVDNQSERLSRTSHAKDITIEALGNEDAYPESLKDQIRVMRDSLSSDESRIGAMIIFLKIIGLSPALLALFIYVFSLIKLVYG